MTRNMRLSRYNSQWATKFLEEKKKLEANVFFNTDGIVIEHIGSTAVPGLNAKATIDMMIGVKSLEEADSYVKNVEKHGYEYVKEYEKNLPDRRFFRKGYDQDISYHIHMVVLETAFWKNHLLFRDILRHDPLIKKKYGELKLILSKKFLNDSFNYSQGKSKFIATAIDLYRKNPTMLLFQPVLPHLPIAEKKITGPRVAEIVEKIRSSEGEAAAFQMAARFTLWARHQHRKFNFKDLDSIANQCFNALLNS